MDQLRKDMEAEFEEIKRFAEATLGEMPEVIVQLYKLNEGAAIEQFLYKSGSGLTFTLTVKVSKPSLPIDIVTQPCI